MDTGGKRPQEDEGRNQTDEATSQGMARVARSHRKLTRARADSSLEPQREHSPADPLISDLQSPELRGTNIFFVVV